MEVASVDWAVTGTVTVAFSHLGKPAFLASHRYGTDLWVFTKPWFRKGFWSVHESFPSAEQAYADLGVLRA